MTTNATLRLSLGTAIEALARDVRYAARMMVRERTFALVSVLILALGIGTNSAVFSYINGTLLNPIPGVPDTRGVVCLSQDAEGDGDVSYLDYLDLRDANRSLTGLAAYGARPLFLHGGEKPVRVWSMLVSSNYFDVLGVRPVMGRGLTPADAAVSGGAPVAVISHTLWQNSFESDRNIIGRTASINRNAHTIVGVMPPGFQGSRTGLRCDIWVPVTMAPHLIPGNDRIAARGDPWLSLIGRLRPEVSREQAAAELTGLIRRIAAQYPDSHSGQPAIAVSPLWRASGVNAYLFPLLSMLSVIAGIVLLLACINVAILFLVRLVGRRAEMATRLAIGADRWQLARPLAVEAILLAAAGGILAVFTSIWSSGLFAALIPPSAAPVALEIRAGREVFLATLGISLLAGLVFGIVPALRSLTVAPVEAVNETAGRTSGGLRRMRMLKGLVVAQVSLSLVLLISAGLLIRSFRAAQRFDPGFNPDRVALASLDLTSAGYNKERGLEFQRQLLDRLRSIPGVEAVTLANWTPLGLRERRVPIEAEGYASKKDESPESGSAVVGPDYCRTMQIPLVAGSDFGPADAAGARPVAIVNQTLARRYWGRQDVVGRRIRVDTTWYTVVGVAKNARYARLDEKRKAFVYLPLLQKYQPGVTIHARMAGDPGAAATAIERAVHELNADLVLFDAGPLSERIRIASAGQRIAATLVGVFGLLTLVLAAVGIYAVIAYSTRQRTHEIGIRMSLGAEKRDIVRLVLGQGFGLAGVGVAIGLAVALLLTRFLRAMLFGVTATDPLTFWGVPAVLCGLVLAASWIPARRALRVDPITALKQR